MIGTYIVTLPDGNIGVSEYNSIPLMGVTQATTEAGAVSQYVMRYVDQKTGRLILNGIKEEFGSLEKFALTVPEVVSGESESPLTPDEISKYRFHALALEIATKQGRVTPEKKDYDRAESLLRATRMRL